MPIVVLTKLVFATFGDFCNNAREVFFIVLQHYSALSEIHFLGGGNKKRSCVVGKSKRKQLSSRNPLMFVIPL